MPLEIAEKILELDKFLKNVFTLENVGSFIILMTGVLALFTFFFVSIRLFFILKDKKTSLSNSQLNSNKILNINHEFTYNQMYCELEELKF